MREEARTEAAMRDADDRPSRPCSCKPRRQPIRFEPPPDGRKVVTRILEDVKQEVRAVNTHCGMMAKLAQRTLYNAGNIAEMANAQSTG